MSFFWNLYLGWKGVLGWTAVHSVTDPNQPMASCEDWQAEQWDDGTERWSCAADEWNSSWDKSDQIVGMGECLLKKSWPIQVWMKLLTPTDEHTHKYTCMFTCTDLHIQTQIYKCTRTCMYVHGAHSSKCSQICRAQFKHNAQLYIYVHTPRRVFVNVIVGLNYSTGQ